MRKLFVLFLAVIMLLMGGCSAQSNTEDISVKYTFPGEWEEHEGTWLVWPHNFGVIGSSAEQTEKNLGRISDEGMAPMDTTIIDVMKKGL